MQRTSPIKFALLSILFLTPLACGGSDAASPSEPESSPQQTANGERVEHSHGAENTDALPTDGSHSSTSGEQTGQPRPDASSNGPNPAQDNTPEAATATAETPAEAASGTESATKRLPIGAGSSVKWEGSKADGSGHVGGFDSIDGHAVSRGQQLERLVVKIDMTSINSDNAKLTSHLKNDDFFSVDQFPEATFFSNSINNNATMTGELAIKGKAHEVSGPANVEWTQDGVRVQATWKIDRTRWGVDYKSSVTGIVADKAINDEVPLSIDLSFSTSDG